MQRPIWRVCAALAMAIGAVVACNGGDPVDTEDELFITATPRQINNQGEASLIEITATKADGLKGTGKVTLKALAGALGNGSLEEQLDLVEGKASTSFTCNKVDPKCTGNVRIDGTWGETTTSVTLVVSGSSTTDGGTTDGGTTPITDGGTGTGDGGVRLTVTTSKATLFTNVGDFAEITASLTQTDGGPRANELITFDTSVGGLQVTSNDPPELSVQAQTNASGQAVVRLVENGVAGTTNVRARHTTSGAQATVPVKITNIQQITYTGTTCGGQACTIMGVNGSGFNEQAQVSFKVVDSTGNPAPGVSVTFTIPNAPTGTTVSPSAITNSQGIATATVSAGPVIGAIVVKAVAITNRVQVDSANIGIRGAKVANQGFSLACDLVNIGVYASANPPAAYNINCKVKVVDRYNNPVGTGTTVNFKVEAGNIENSVATKAYSPTGNNADEGTGTVRFNTTGGTFFPVDVPPLDAAPNQSPFPRDAEPRGPYGQLTANPRDGLVTIIAYTRGEEWFSDSNSNGVRDSGEQFIDQGEPFVDSNDNGIWDSGETYIDEAPADGRWNGPDGTWNNDTSIWTETRMLYTGRPAGNLAGHVYITPAQFAEPCTGGVPKGGLTYVKMYYGDDFFNRPQAQGTAFTASHTASKGAVRVLNSGLLDGYGFGMERRLLNSADQTACTASSAICSWKVLFTDWGNGYVSDAEIKGATAGDTTGCQNDTVTLGTTVLNVTTFSATTGGIQ
ncbi:Ig-like domain-containing protein [Hyalangium rubrum]|uniref:Ig-like domain-containing protein n=1 Tax=Hyalangium rubrum TaxID=3103134 RepID=A0ABU5HFM1_9BACT|nr:Ig-like domain-containing protein [Hyalangium sp. s54d21]MDY7231939.1 Ig-like domain-containing protein [Hyalangium sp. s54d21]